MSPDGYLHIAVIFAGYFVKIAVAYLLCWLLARLLGSPRQRFVMWLAFMFGSAGYWFYAVMSSPPVLTVTATGAAPIAHRLHKLVHQFLVPARFEHPTVILGRVLISAYMLGVLLLLADAVWKRVWLHLLLRQGAAPSHELKQLFAEMRRHFRVRHCELLVLDKVSSPATVFWWRPRILLPQICEQLEDNALMADILYHELAHVARRDYLWSTLTDLICRLLFFHPAVWQARKQMQIQREMACDFAVVVARPEHRADYAHTLTRVARLCLPRRYPVIGIDFASAPSLLAHRVHALLSDPENSSWIKGFSRLVAGLGLISVYGLLCSGITVAVAFAPSSGSQPAVEFHAAQTPPMHPATKHKVRHESPTESEAEGLITDSPAYRLKTSDGQFVNEALNSEQQSNVPISDFRGAGGTIPRFGSHIPRSPGTTLGSIIAATVGTVVGDRDDRKRKDNSH